MVRFNNRSTVLTVSHSEAVLLTVRHWLGLNWGFWEVSSAPGPHLTPKSSCPEGTRILTLGWPHQGSPDCPLSLPAPCVCYTPGFQAQMLRVNPAFALGQGGRSAAGGGKQAPDHSKHSSLGEGLKGVEQEAESKYKGQQREGKARQPTHWPFPEQSRGWRD